MSVRIPLAKVRGPTSAQARCQTNLLKTKNLLPRPQTYRKQHVRKQERKRQKKENATKAYFFLSCFSRFLSCFYIPFYYSFTTEDSFRLKLLLLFLLLSLLFFFGVLFESMNYYLPNMAESYKLP